MRKPAKTLRILASASLIASTSLVSFSASANPCAGQQAGCVLPVEAPPAPTPATYVEEESGGIGWLLPALLAVGAIVGAILLFDDDDDEPVSV